MGWFRRRQKGASDEPLRENDFLVYVYRYISDSAASEQFAEFERWPTEYAGTSDWVFCGLAASHDEGGMFVRHRGRGRHPRRRTFNEFVWMAASRELDEDWVWRSSVGRRARLFLTRILGPEPIVAVERPDGTWVIPSPEG